MMDQVEWEKLSDDFWSARRLRDIPQRMEILSRVSSKLGLKGGFNDLRHFTKKIQDALLVERCKLHLATHGIKVGSKVRARRDTTPRVVKAIRPTGRLDLEFNFVSTPGRNKAFRNVSPLIYFPAE
jgi:hypothetical protein